MTTDKPSHLVPKLRFAEFVDEPPWECPPLKKLAKRITQRNIHGAELRALTNSAEHGVVDQREYFYKDIAINTDNYYIVEPGDYVYNPRISSAAPVGPISKNQIGMGVMSPLYTVFRFRSEANNFFAHYFKSSHWHGYLRRVSSSGARHDRMAITYNDLMRMPIPTPSTREQQKIADCLGSLDDLIAANGRKLEALRQHKQGLMQQLFPQPGEAAPRLRFPEFVNAAWESRTLGTLVSNTERPIVMDDETEYALVTVKRRYGGVITRNVLKGKAISVKSQFLIEANDFLISKRQIVHDACGLVPAKLAGSIVSNEYSVLTAKNGCDIEFFNYFTQQPCVSESFLQSSVGIVIEKMLFKLDWWLKLAFLFPSFVEQQRIANCLSSLDAQLAAQAQKLNVLKTHKQGLLQQLFPALEVQ